MSKQFHFVVMIDENNKASIDYDTSLNFDGGEVWDTEKEEWLSSFDVWEEYEQKTEYLLDLLNAPERITKC